MEDHPKEGGYDPKAVAREFGVSISRINSVFAYLSMNSRAKIVGEIDMDVLENNKWCATPA